MYQTFQAAETDTPDPKHTNYTDYSSDLHMYPIGTSFLRPVLQDLKDQSEIYHRFGWSLGQASSTAALKCQPALNHVWNESRPGIPSGEEVFGINRLN